MAKSCHQCKSMLSKTMRAGLYGEQLTDDCNSHVSGELPCKFGLNYYHALKPRTVSKQTHIRSSVSMACPPICRRQLSLQRTRRLVSNTHFGL